MKFSTHLSDLNWLTGGTDDPINGLGPIELDQSNGSNLPNDGQTISINGTTYSKGLGVYSYSQVSYDISSGYDYFTSDIGIDDENTDPCIALQFMVLLDGTNVFTSAVKRSGDQIESIFIPIAGYSTLKLIVVQSAGAGNCGGSASWGDARLLLCNSPSSLAGSKMDYELENFRDRISTIEEQDLNRSSQEQINHPIKRNLKS